MNTHNLPSTCTTLIALLVALCSTLFYPTIGNARNGDDWVLVARFKSQQNLANAGDPDAMYEIARMYELGRGTEPNMQKAIQWYERAINKGQNNARAHLGVLYFEGNWIKRDLKKAHSLLQPAAEAGNPTAQYYIGQMYEQGEGLRHDVNQAVYWYKKSADGGSYLAVARIKALGREPTISPVTPVSESTPVKSEKTVVKTPPHRVNMAVKTAPRPPAAHIPDSPAKILLQTILDAKWQRNDRPTGFLPSDNTSCTKNTHQVVTCKSGEQKRNTGDAIITYVTESTLSSFTNSDQFTVKYYNNVHKVKAIARQNLDGETVKSRVPPNIHLGKQSMVHKLRCELQSVDKLVCVKDNSMLETYTRQK